MKPKIALGIGITGYFARTVITGIVLYLINLIGRILELDFEIYQTCLTIYRCLWILLTLIVVVTICVPLFFKDTFKSVIGKVAGGIAAVLTLATIILFIFSVGISNLVLNCMAALAMGIYMLFSNSWLPVKITAIVSLALSMISSLLLYFYYCDVIQHFPWFADVNSVITVLCWILALATILLIGYWVFLKKPSAKEKAC